MEPEREREVVEALKEFNENFKIKLEPPPPDERVKKPVKQESLELRKEKDELKTFHQNFKLHTDEKAQQAPNTLSLPNQHVHRKKRRKSKKPPKSKSFDDVYTITGELLGRGAHSHVTTCRHRHTNQEFAVKVVPKLSDHVREKVLREVEILYHCRNNRNFLHLIDCFEGAESFHLVFEKMEGGPLLGHIQKRERFTEREASRVVGEVANALAYLHEKGIAHRDLKPDNVLCESKDEVVPIRICDFDLSNMVGSDTPTTTPLLLTPVGSAEFMAPEVVETFLGDNFSYDKKCDLWSLGVMLFMMLCGHPPFYGECGSQCGWKNGEESCPQCQDMLLTRIKSGEYSFPDEEWKDISSDAKDLIQQLLQIDASQRLSAKQVLLHPWVLQEAPETPLQTPGVLNRQPSIPSELSKYVASCLQFTRQLSSQMAQDSTDPLDPSTTSPPAPLILNKSPSTNVTQNSITLSPPGSSELAVRRHNDSKKDFTAATSTIAAVAAT